MTSKNPINKSRRASSTSPVQINVSKCTSGDVSTESRRKSCFAAPVNYHHQRGNMMDFKPHHDRRISLPMDNLR